MHFGADFNYFDVMSAARKSYTRLLEPVCELWQLTRNELDVMLFLHNNPEFDRAADIVSRRGLAKSHVSLSVTNLEKKELLTRHFDENDRRTAHLILTAEGEKIAEEAHALQMQYFSALYEGITEEEFRLWREITERVSQNIRNMEIQLANPGEKQEKF